MEPSYHREKESLQGMSVTGGQAYPSDYDENPIRFRVGSESPWKYGSGDVHEEVAGRFATEQLKPVLDVGCGEGRLMKLLRTNGVDAVGLDRSPTMLRTFDGIRVLGDAQSIPLRDGAFGGVAALYMLYHLAEPETALREARRLLRPGGLFVAATPSRYTDPEFGDFQPIETATFDAEVAPAMVRAVFGNVEVEAWDGPFITLPSRSAVAEYLFGRGMERSKAEAVARQMDVPLSVTKTGCLVWGRRGG